MAVLCARWPDFKVNALASYQPSKFGPSRVTFGDICYIFVQILTPFFKPNKLSLARGYWNAAHHLFGYATILLSVLVIFRGFHLMVVRTLLSSASAALRCTFVDTESRTGSQKQESVANLFFSALRRPCRPSHSLSCQACSLGGNSQCSITEVLNPEGLSSEIVMECTRERETK